MRGSVWVPTEIFKQFADGTVCRDGIVPRPDSLEPIGAVSSGAENPTKIEIRLNALLLDIIETFVIGLPNIDFGAFNGIAFDI